MATFLDLRTKVKRRLIDVPSSTDAEVGDLINEAMRILQEAHNFQIMEAQQSYTTVDGQRLLGTKNSDWKEARKKPWLNQGDGGSKEIEWMPSEKEAVKIYALADTEQKGEPKYILDASDTDLEVFPRPDENSMWLDKDYRVIIPYYKFLADLSADGDTNWFTTHASNFLIYKATAEGFLLNWDEARGGAWLERARQEMARVISVDRRRKKAKATQLIPRRDVHASFNQGRM